MKRSVVLMVFICLVVGVYGQSMKVHKKGSAVPESYALSGIDSITFEMGTTNISFSTDFEVSSFDSANWVDVGTNAATGLIATVAHSPTRSFKCRGADWDGWALNGIATRTKFVTDTLIVDFWFDSLSLGTGSGGGLGWFGVLISDSSVTKGPNNQRDNYNTKQNIYVGQWLDGGDVLQIMEPNGTKTQTTLNLRSLTGWHHMNVWAARNGTSTTIVVTVDGSEKIRKTIASWTYGPFGGALISVGGQYTNTSQVFIDDLTVTYTPIK